MPPRYWTKSLNAGAGCAPVGEKCSHCWAARIVNRMTHNPIIQAGGGVAGPPGELVKDGLWTGRVRWDVDKMKPSLWREGQIVAVWWLGDLFMDNVPDSITLAQLTATAADTIRRHDKGLPPNRYLYLTSRPRNLVRRFRQWMHDMSLERSMATVRLMLRTHWWGASVWDERSWDSAAKAFLELPSQMHRWMSLEPWLKPISFVETGPEPWGWIVAGSMTGPGAIPAHGSWFRQLRDWCAEHDVSFFLKQLDRRGNRELDGRTHDDYPWEESKP
jgi:protein gp37